MSVDAMVNTFLNESMSMVRTKRFDTFCELGDELLAVMSYGIDTEVAMDFFTIVDEIRATIRKPLRDEFDLMVAHLEYEIGDATQYDDFVIVLFVTGNEAVASQQSMEDKNRTADLLMELFQFLGDHDSGQSPSMNAKLLEVLELTAEDARTNERHDQLDSVSEDFSDMLVGIREWIAESDVSELTAKAARTQFVLLTTVGAVMNDDLETAVINAVANLDYEKPNRSTRKHLMEILDWITRCYLEDSQPFWIDRYMY